MSYYNRHEIKYEENVTIEGVSFVIDKFEHFIMQSIGIRFIVVFNVKENDFKDSKSLLSKSVIIFSQILNIHAGKGTPTDGSYNNRVRKAINQVKSRLGNKYPLTKTNVLDVYLIPDNSGKKVCKILSK